MFFSPGKDTTLQVKVCRYQSNTTLSLVFSPNVNPTWCKVYHMYSHPGCRLHSGKTDLRHFLKICPGSVIRLDAAWEQYIQVCWENIFLYLNISASGIAGSVNKTRQTFKMNETMLVQWKSVVMFCVCSVCCSSSRGRYLGTLCNELCVRPAHGTHKSTDSTRELQIQSSLTYSTFRRQ